MQKRKNKEKRKLGIYDIVGKEGIQIKCTPEPGLVFYQIGDKIQLEDGAYITYEGVFIVNKGKVQATSKKVFNKWGGQLEPSEILHTTKPIPNATEKLQEHKVKNRNKFIVGTNVRIKNHELSGKTGRVTEISTRCFPGSTRAAYGIILNKPCNTKDYYWPINYLFLYSYQLDKI